MIVNFGSQKFTYFRIYIIFLFVLRIHEYLFLYSFVKILIFKLHFKVHFRSRRIHIYFYNHVIPILELNPTTSANRKLPPRHASKEQKSQRQSFRIRRWRPRLEAREERDTMQFPPSFVVVRGVYTGVRRRFQGIRYCGRNTEQRSRLFRGLNTHTPPPVGGVYRLRASPTTYPSSDTRYQGTLVAPRRTQSESPAPTAVPRFFTC